MAYQSPAPWALVSRLSGWPRHSPKGQGVRYWPDVDEHQYFLLDRSHFLGTHGDAVDSNAGDDLDRAPKNAGDSTLTTVVTLIHLCPHSRNLPLNQSLKGHQQRLKALTVLDKTEGYHYGFQG